jgi:hypothetical protein
MLLLFVQDPNAKDFSACCILRAEPKIIAAFSPWNLRTTSHFLTYSEIYQKNKFNIDHRFFFKKSIDVVQTNVFLLRWFWGNHDILVFLCINCIYTKLPVAGPRRFR